MNIYIDESGSINNKLDPNQDFVITLVVPIDKKGLEKAYKRFISSNYDALKSLDKKNKMFLNGKFHEIKGSQLKGPMKKKFVKFFSKEKHFELFYIQIKNSNLKDDFCNNTARSFNYVIRLALQYFINKGLLNRKEDYMLQLDERNEKTETKNFLENYLNTELTLSGVTTGKFTVRYFDSSNNKFIQIADVFSNLFYSHILNHQYEGELKLLVQKGILKHTFIFPPTP